MSVARRTSISSFVAPLTAAPPVENAEALNRMIEEDIRKENARRKEERRKEVKVMLLGQAESGKSTLQKQFQIYYAKKSLDGERPCWKPVVYFNIIKAVRLVFNELEYQFSTQGRENTEAPKAIQDQIAELRTKLLPLTALEELLASHLSGGATIGTGGRTGAFVRTGWQSLVGGRGSSSNDVKATQALARTAEVSSIAAKYLANSVKDVQALWAHPSVKLLLHNQKVRLEDSASFFLDEIARIAEPDYVPSTDDILNVRLQTLGVMEHSFPITMGGLSYNWKIYDVGGARGQRQTWIPFFDDGEQLPWFLTFHSFMVSTSYGFLRHLIPDDIRIKRLAPLRHPLPFIANVFLTVADSLVSGASATATAIIFLALYKYAGREGDAEHHFEW
ncbi:hypothetical protein D9756_010364 [Leucocoprinus leucothites]|uniref:Uncharacterized protein n=1 Tax=Leucocoprinus leucothites TaxID=201217 RepID=A0A8H5FRQ3_9AGAR|nr:hypothetical protein D9756_010364 [Leucoagaricus leucothites]